MQDVLFPGIRPELSRTAPIGPDKGSLVMYLFVDVRTIRNLEN